MRLVLIAFTMCNKRKTIKTVEQVKIAKALVDKVKKSGTMKAVEHTKTDWIYLPDFVYEYKLPYHKTRRFVLKLVRWGYARTRAPSIIHSVRKPFDFELTDIGKKKLKTELSKLLDDFSAI
jgi:hypothetical protein